MFFKYPYLNTKFSIFKSPAVTTPATVCPPRHILNIAIMLLPKLYNPEVGTGETRNIVDNNDGVLI
jgi:hypothetical protein